ncbi:hypothetical protein [Pseudovibrio denitrificans]|uniref:hypothetical protein n=1 Tax=Pseudovibrio denitrificans TaxID=258256 RepID=UPI000B2E8BE0|nr:hypothetical protein [Pseudovibrio denitrificans]
MDDWFIGLIPFDLEVMTVVGCAEANWQSSEVLLELGTPAEDVDFSVTCIARVWTVVTVTIDVRQRAGQLGVWREVVACTTACE